MMNDLQMDSAFSGQWFSGSVLIIKSIEIDAVVPKRCGYDNKKDD
jgi:hypothetical protein